MSDTPPTSWTCGGCGGGFAPTDEIRKWLGGRGSALIWQLTPEAEPCPKCSAETLADASECAACQSPLGAPCPSCQGAMRKKLAYGKVPLRVCLRCGGTWFFAGAIDGCAGQILGSEREKNAPKATCDGCGAEFLAKDLIPSMHGRVCLDCQLVARRGDLAEAKKKHARRQWFSVFLPQANGSFSMGQRIMFGAIFFVASQIASWFMFYRHFDLLQERVHEEVEKAAGLHSD